MDKGIQVDDLYIEFCKTFYKMNHNCIYWVLQNILQNESQLFEIGIHGNLLRWFVSTLTDHKYPTLTVFDQTPLQLLPEFRRDHIWEHIQHFYVPLWNPVIVLLSFKRQKNLEWTKINFVLGGYWMVQECKPNIYF